MTRTVPGGRSQMSDIQLLTPKICGKQYTYYMFLLMIIGFNATGKKD